MQKLPACPPTNLYPKSETFNSSSTVLHILNILYHCGQRPICLKENHSLSPPTFYFLLHSHSPLYTHLRTSRHPSTTPTCPPPPPPKMPPRKSATPSATPATKPTSDDAKACQLILTYLVAQNRPYSATEISSNLHNAVTKTRTDKLLKEMFERGEIGGRASGKQWVYWGVQVCVVSVCAGRERLG